MYVMELFRAPNRMSAEKEEIELEMTKSYKCLESQKTNTGTAEEITCNSTNQWKRNTGVWDVVEILMKEKDLKYVSR